MFYFYERRGDDTWASDAKYVRVNREAFYEKSLAELNSMGPENIAKEVILSPYGFIEKYGVRSVAATLRTSDLAERLGALKNGRLALKRVSDSLDSSVKVAMSVADSEPSLSSLNLKERVAKLEAMFPGYEISISRRGYLDAKRKGGVNAWDHDFE